jgi:beta-lactamase regulating signal transducer with metallopeptidase domain
MDSLLRIGLTNALFATVLALAVALASRWCRRPALVHSLWLLVLLKLLVPPFVSAPIQWQHVDRVLSVAGFASSAPAEPRHAPPSTNPAPEVAAAVPESSSVWPGLKSSEARVEQQETPELGVPTPALATLKPPASLSVSWQTLVVALWVAGSVTWFTWIGVRFWHVRRLLSYACPAPIEVQDRGQQLSRIMGMTRCPSVAFLSGQVSPMLWALLGRPRLLMPAMLWDGLTPEQRDALLVHELAHLRRGDHWVRRLELLVAGLFWWHPVVWWAQRRLQQAEEECCDAWVVATLPAASEVYAEALIATAAFLSRTNSAVPVGASGIGTVHLLKRRLVMILNGTTPKTMSRWGVLTMLSVAGLLLPLGATFAQRDEPATETRAESTEQPAEQPRRSKEDIRKARAAVEKLETELRKAMDRLQEIQGDLQQAHARLAKMEGRAGQVGFTGRAPVGTIQAMPGSAPMMVPPQGFGVQGSGGVIVGQEPRLQPGQGMMTGPVGGGGPGAGGIGGGVVRSGPGVGGGGFGGGMGGGGSTVGQPMHAAGGIVRGQLGYPGMDMGTQERRLRDLEKKLDRLMEQMESLRKQRTRSSEDDPRER